MHQAFLTFLLSIKIYSQSKFFVGSGVPCLLKKIDTDLKTSEYDEAHSYFRLRKNLSNKSFNEIFKVRKYVELKRPLGEVKWWKDESTKLDEF